MLPFYEQLCNDYANNCDEENIQTNAEAEDSNQTSKQGIMEHLKNIVIQIIKEAIESKETIQVNEEQIMNIRLKNQKAVVIKYEGQYRIVTSKKVIESLKQLKPLNGVRPHLCFDCQRCSTGENGCQKVIDGFMTPAKKNQMLGGTYADWDYYVGQSKRLEKYPFVEVGIESINSFNGFFSIIGCSNFIMDENHIQTVDKNNILISLAQFYGADVRNSKQLEDYFEQKIYSPEIL